MRTRRQAPAAIKAALTCARRSGLARQGARASEASRASNARLGRTARGGQSRLAEHEDAVGEHVLPEQAVAFAAGRIARDNLDRDVPRPPPDATLSPRPPVHHF